MSRPTLSRAAALLALLCAGCFKSPATPGATPKNCAKSEDCTSGSRCVSGSCQPGCRADSDCPDNGLCHQDGTCGTRPDCVQDTDCPATFQCQAGRCACTTDYSCWTQTGPNGPDTTRICVDGSCQASSSCTADSQCTDGRYCGPAGICTAPCLADKDCGGSSQVGGALTCNNGRCTSPCLTDSAPAGQGGCPTQQICSNGLCLPAQCSTFNDCGDPTLYCTSADHGRCEPIRSCDPAVPEVCGPLSDCAQYPADQCPPGFDCSRFVCIDRPSCFSDAQCAHDQICDLGGCETAPACASEADCDGAHDCVGGHCVPHLCRGPADCPSGELCSAGACIAPAPGSDIDHVRLLTPIPTVEVGQTRQLAAVALTANDVAEPVDHFDWSISPANVASVDGSGKLTALAPGQATLTVGFTRPDGGHATPDTASFLVVDAPSSARAVVVDSESGAPIAGAVVRICTGYTNGACTAPVDLATDASGSASFTAPAGSYDLSVRDPAVDGAGHPAHDVVHLLGITATDVLVPLPANRAHAAAGFTGSIDFSKVQTQGGLRMGLAGSSIPDLAAFDLPDLVGQPWVATATIPQSPFGGALPGFDGGTIQVPITGGTVADLDDLGGVGLRVNIKDSVYALGSPGLRTGWAFAGRIDPQLFFGSYGSAFATGALGAVLPFFGAFDHGLRAAIDEPLRPTVLDQEDLDGNGVCEDVNRCQAGGEELPDYASFPSTFFVPKQPQDLRVDVLTPASPAGAGQVILVAGAQIPGSGLLPLGLSSSNGGGAAPGEVTMRMAPLYGGFEASGYALLAIATGTGSGAPQPDGGLAQAPQAGISVAIARASTLPTQVDLAAPLLPFVQGASYDPATRTLAPGGGWSDISASSQLLRLAVVGSTQRVFVYASPAAAASGLVIPPAPGSDDPAADPAAQATLVALQLPAGDDLDAVASLPGDTLLDLSRLTQAFTRAPAQ